jgi:hypothetical protein
MLDGMMMATAQRACKSYAVMKLSLKTYRCSTTKAGPVHNRRKHNEPDVIKLLVEGEQAPKVAS